MTFDVKKKPGVSVQLTSPSYRPVQQQATSAAPEYELQSAAPVAALLEPFTLTNSRSVTPTVQRAVSAPVLTAARLLAVDRATVQRAAEDVQTRQEEVNASGATLVDRGLPVETAASLQRQAPPLAPAPPPTLSPVQRQLVTETAGHDVTVSFTRDARYIPGAIRAEMALGAIQRAVKQGADGEALYARLDELATTPQDQAAVQRAVNLQRQQEERAVQAREGYALQVEHVRLQRQLAEAVQRQEEAGLGTVLQRVQARQGGGEPLPAAVQRHLEAGLNADLNRVRVHHDAEADRLARSVGAKAFTTGADIYFRRGLYDPYSAEGLELVAHEATHTVQQAQGKVGPGMDPDAGLEAEARQMGGALAATSSKSASPSAVHAVQPQHFSPLGAGSSGRSVQRASVPATTKVNADVALKMLDTYSRTGTVNFKPELGKGGASWFVTRGNPYVGIDASKNVPVEVNIAVNRQAVVFREADLQKLLAESTSKFAAAAEAEFRTRINLPSGALNSDQRKKLAYFTRQFVESKMWDAVGAKIRASGAGVGRVILENSQFSKQGDGEFAVVTDPKKIRVTSSIDQLVGTLLKSGATAEQPVVEAATRLARIQKISGVVRGVFRYGGRILIVTAVAADAYRIYHAQDRKLAVVESVGGWAGAGAASASFAAFFAPADVAGPWAWAAHGVGTLVAGGVGYWVGSKTTRYIYEITLVK